MALNFRVGNSQAQTIDVGNEVCGFIEQVPKYGHFTTQEQIAWQKWSLAATDKTTWAEHQCVIVAQLLSLRLKQPITTQDLIDLPDFGLVEAAYEFFLKERDRDTPSKQLMFISGAEGQAISVEYAKTKGACVVASPDLPDNYYVLESPADRADKFLVIADFTAGSSSEDDEVEIRDSDLGKDSKQPKTSKCTGTTSTGS